MSDTPPKGIPAYVGPAPSQRYPGERSGIEREDPPTRYPAPRPEPGVVERIAVTEARIAESVRALDVLREKVEDSAKEFDRQLSAVRKRSEEQVKEMVETAVAPLRSHSVTLHALSSQLAEARPLLEALKEAAKPVRTSPWTKVQIAVGILIVVVGLILAIRQFPSPTQFEHDHGVLEQLRDDVRDLQHDRTNDIERIRALEGKAHP